MRTRIASAIPAIRRPFSVHFESLRVCNSPITLFRDVSTRMSVQPFVSKTGQSPLKSASQEIRALLGFILDWALKPIRRPILFNFLFLNFIWRCPRNKYIRRKEIRGNPATECPCPYLRSSSAAASTTTLCIIICRP